MKVNLGGTGRVGSGKKLQVDLKTYNRSTHDLSYILRTSAAAGTLIPFMSEVGLLGDTFDIDLDCDVKTHPTIGPLFGSYKIQLDVYEVPMRLYNGKLHMNMVELGLDMKKVKFPLINMTAAHPDPNKNMDNQQINPSSIFAYLNIRGLGRHASGGTVRRFFNAIPWLGYWDIYKNYYANKQEGIGAVIHNGRSAITENISSIWVGVPLGEEEEVPSTWVNSIPTPNESYLRVVYTGTTPDPDTIRLLVSWVGGGSDSWIAPQQIWNTISAVGANELWFTNKYASIAAVRQWRYVEPTDTSNTGIQVETFPLENIDEMRMDILSAVKDVTPFTIGEDSELAPYSLALQKADTLYAKQGSQEGLALKTYQSDRFQNWMSTEWIDGSNGINELTKVNVQDGYLKMDALILQKKLYDVMNQVAMAGGSYDDWEEAVYGTEKFRKTETPIYHGGLSKELGFQEVVANTAYEGGSEAQPLGQLAGRGAMTDKHKGGRVTIKVQEACYIMGIFSLTPRVDYSQGNKWDVNLKTMDDLHKPGMDQIGFQNLITDEMAWFDTICDSSGNLTTFSAGKQPAWVQYMTNTNKTLGNFAIEDNEMFMTLNRRYEVNPSTGRILDLTTYIDPVKYNNIFADTQLDAQNFWVQMRVGIHARRKMSARVMPNL